MKQVHKIAVAAVFGSTSALVGAVHASVIGLPTPNVGLFGGQGIDFSGSVYGGAAVTNGSFNALGGLGTVGGIYGAGSLTDTSGVSTSNGPILFNQNVTVAPGTVNGPIQSGGNLIVTGGVTNGNLRAVGNITTKGTVFGNVNAGNELINDGTINGNATFGSTMTTGVFGSVNGSSGQAALSPGPLPYASIAAPTDPFAGTLATPGLPDLTITGSATAPIAPGHYGLFQPNTFVGGAIYLTGGDYYFNGANFLSGNIFSVNLVNVSSSNPVRIYSTGDINWGLLIGTTVNGMSVSSLNGSNMALASDVLLESTGNITFDGATNFAGTLYAPDGNINLNGTTVVGSVIAGGYVEATNSNITYEAGTTVGVTATVPEPASIALTAVSALAMTRRSRRRP